jgi:hypothetical protein
LRWEIADGREKVKVGGKRSGVALRGWASVWVRGNEDGEAAEVVGVEDSGGIAAAVAGTVEVDASEWIVPASFLRFEGCSLGGLGIAMVAEAALDRPTAFRVVGAMGF